MSAWVGLVFIGWFAAPAASDDMARSMEQGAQAARPDKENILQTHQTKTDIAPAVVGS